MILPDDSLLTKSIDLLRGGGIGIFPTDTAFALSCRIDDEKSVRRLFAIKGREGKKATPILVSSIKMAEEYVGRIDREVREKLLEKYWPGALTVVMYSREWKVSSLVLGGGQTVGIRMPDHEIAIRFIDAVGVPVIGTSANFSGEDTPFSTRDVNPQLIKKVDFFIPGESVNTQASTVIDVTQTPWKIVRQGAIAVL